MKTSFRALLVGLCALFAVSCATQFGSVIKDYRDVKNPDSGYVVFRAFIENQDDKLEKTFVHITNSYDSGSRLQIEGSKSAAPIVCAVKPGSYRVLWLSALEKQGLLNGLFGGARTFQVFPKPFPTKFVFTVKPGQIVYIGDFSFRDKTLSYSYDMLKAKQEIAKVQSDIEGFEWVSIQRETPAWYEAQR